MTISDIDGNTPASAKGRDMCAQWIAGAESDEDSVGVAVDFIAAVRLEVVVTEIFLDPGDLGLFDALLEAVVEGGGWWGDEDGFCAHSEGFGTAGAGERVRTDDYVDVVCAVKGGEKSGGGHGQWSMSRIAYEGGVYEGEAISQDLEELDRKMCFWHSKDVRGIECRKT